MNRAFVFCAAVFAVVLGGCDVRESVKESETTTQSSTSADAYPLKVCVVSGEELGSMGEPVVVTHEGTTVKLCCKNCIPDFKADPATYVAKLTAAKP